MNKVLLIVSVVTIGCSNPWIVLIKYLFHNIVHHGNWDISKSFFFDHFQYRTNDFMKCCIIQCNHDSGSRLVDSVYDLFTVKLFQCSVFLNYFHVRPLLLSVMIFVRQSLSDWYCPPSDNWHPSTLLQSVHPPVRLHTWLLQADICLQESVPMYTRCRPILFSSEISSVLFSWWRILLHGSAGEAEHPRRK